MNIEIRRVKAVEAVKLRDCRLAALKDSPHAFGANLADEQKKPLSSFESDSLRLSLSENSSMFLAHCADEVYGQIGAFIDSDNAYICAMWVSPKARNMKVGTKLVETANYWLLACGHKNIYAWVVDNNDIAISFYNRIGFKATESKQTLPSDKSLIETLYMYSQ